jgi:pilus assembly protein CpaC
VIPQPDGTHDIQFRPCGVRAEVLPLILDHERVRLDIAAEVSERDDSHTTESDGFVIPSIRARRVNTQVEMKWGETFMLGGLMSASSPTHVLTSAKLLGKNQIQEASSRSTEDAAEKQLIVLVTPKRVSTPE